jgi:myxalamid-type nonribosomal peptide synthetase MxaA
MPIARFAERVNAHGFAIDRVPYARWRASLIDAVSRGEENALAPFVPFFGEEPETEEPLFDTTHTDAALAAVGLVCPPADDALVATYLTALSARGFLAVPVMQEDI